MEKILEEVGLSTLLQRFMEERIEPEIVLAMTDVELTRLGVATIGDRVRLRAVCRSSPEREKSDHSKTSPEGATPASTSSSSRGPSAASVASERAKLFDPRHSRTGGKKRKATGGRTWTVQVICLADRQQTKIPNSSEKQVLHNAGLGLKKIKFELTDSEQQVANKILSDDKKENNEIVGFPQLRQGGGFELLQCLPNCRELTMINCHWAVTELKANLGSQSKMYVRPIQINLSTKPINPESRAQVKQKCNGCKKEFMMNELRGHLGTSTLAQLDLMTQHQNRIQQITIT